MGLKFQCRCPSALAHTCFPKCLTPSPSPWYTALFCSCAPLSSHYRLYPHFHFPYRCNHLQACCHGAYLFTDNSWRKKKEWGRGEEVFKLKKKSCNGIKVSYWAIQTAFISNWENQSTCLSTMWNPGFDQCLLRRHHRHLLYLFHQRNSGN